MNGKRLSEVIESEIQWCLSNPSSELSVEFQKGFVSGLRQAKFFIDKAVEQRECHYCEGSGLLITDQQSYPCRFCNGTGISDSVQPLET